MKKEYLYVGVAAAATFYMFFSGRNVPIASYVYNLGYNIAAGGVISIQPTA